MSIISAKNLSYSYVTHVGKTLALDSVSFEIERGAFVSLIGENGSGKSTLAKMLNALILFDSGELSVCDFNAAEKSNLIDIRKSCGMVFQNPDNALVSSIVEDDVAFGPENLGLEQGEIEERVSEAMERVGVTELKGKELSKLSGGQKQKVAIAGALAMRPEILVFDEATSMLDPVGKDEIIDIMKSLHENGITIINITHNMEETLNSSLVLAMKNGQLLSQASPEKTFSDRMLVDEMGLELPFSYRVERDVRGRDGQTPPAACPPPPIQFAPTPVCPPGEEKTPAMPGIHPPDSPENRNEARPQTDTAIEVRGLSHVYGKGLSFETKALTDVSFSVARGEIVCVAGATGSGKSTLIEHMNGLLTPTSGEVFLDGKNVFESKKTLAEARRKVGFVFQYPEYQLFADTCLADVAFGPTNMGLAKDEAERRAIFAMEELGLDPEKLAEKSPFELSGGEKRKVAIAGVMAMEPTVLVLDEPTAFLDPRSHRGFMELILKLNREKSVTIILVTHNMDDACEYADRLLLLKDGELVANGEPREIFSDEKLLAETKLHLPKAAAYAREHGAMGAIKYAELIEALRAEKAKEDAKKNAE